MICSWVRPGAKPPCTWKRYFQSKDWFLKNRRHNATLRAEILMTLPWKINAFLLSSLNVKTFFSDLAFWKNLVYIEIVTFGRNCLVLRKTWTFSLHKLWTAVKKTFGINVMVIKKVFLAGPAFTRKVLLHVTPDLSCVWHYDCRSLLITTVYVEIKIKEHNMVWSKCMCIWYVYMIILIIYVHVCCACVCVYIHILCVFLSCAH